MVTGKTKHPIVSRSLTPERQRALQMLQDDYKMAAAEHVPGYKGGNTALKIAIASIPNGWRRV
jgi:antibiotic biosynthesis monooxygenase (ABM) superfamily enzyme